MTKKFNNLILVFNYQQFELFKRMIIQDRMVTFKKSAKNLISLGKLK